MLVLCGIFLGYFYPFNIPPSLDQLTKPAVFDHWKMPAILDKWNMPEAPDQATETTGGEAVSAAFSMCGRGSWNNCVIDGDTFHFQGQSVRVADIDAPETHPSRCAYEADLGARATSRLYELLNAGPFTMESLPDRDRDIYGRKLRIITRNGQSLGRLLVSEGLAREWTGHRMPWCS